MVKKKTNQNKNLTTKPDKKLVAFETLIKCNIEFLNPPQHF